MSNANVGNATVAVAAPVQGNAQPQPTVQKAVTQTASPSPPVSVSKLGADLLLPAFVIAMVALNLAVLMLLSRMLGGLDLRGALVEKDPEIIQDTTRTLVVSQQTASDAAVEMAKAAGPAFAAAAAAGTAPPATVPAAVTAQDVADALPASYSRIAGAFGAIVLAGALYGLANYLIWAAFFKPGDINNVLDKMGSFFLAGSALFAPYAFNQLTSIFPRPPAR